MKRQVDPLTEAVAGTADAAVVAAGFNLLGRTGAVQSQLEHITLEDRDGEPVVWVATAWHDAPGDGKIRNVAAGNSARQATYRLLETLVDGGMCAHCRRPTGIDDTLGTPPGADHICWVQYDPELQTYRRACEDAKS